MNADRDHSEQPTRVAPPGAPLSAPGDADHPVPQPTGHDAPRAPRDHQGDPMNEDSAATGRPTGEGAASGSAAAATVHDEPAATLDSPVGARGDSCEGWGRATPRACALKLPGGGAISSLPNDPALLTEPGTSRTVAARVEPVERRLYRFWAIEPGHVDQEWTGWWRRATRTWHALFDDGVWDTEFVTRWELVDHAVARVEALHHNHGYGGSAFCDNDGYAWPCPTAVALAGPEATEGGAS